MINNIEHGKRVWKNRMMKKVRCSLTFFSSKITVNVKSYNATRLYYSIGQDVMSCRSTNQVPYTCL